MKVFLDTSVLVASFYADHPQHAASFEILVRCQKRDAACGAHSLAEVYATLTGMTSAARRASGDQALLYIGNLRERLAIVSLNGQEYAQVLTTAAAANITGGAIYDAILGQCALKSGAEVLYTWNSRDFLRLPAPIARRVRQPDGAGQ